MEAQARALETPDPHRDERIASHQQEPSESIPVTAISTTTTLPKTRSFFFGR